MEVKVAFKNKGGFQHYSVALMQIHNSMKVIFCDSSDAYINLKWL